MSKIKIIYFYSIIAVVITVPFFDHINSIFIGILALFSFLSSPISHKINRLKSNPWVLLFIAHYLVQVMGYFNSENTKTALFVLEKKGGMAILPLFLVTGALLDIKKIRTLLLTFVGSVIVGGLIMILFSSIEYYNTGNSNVFFYHQLANQLDAHAIYYSVAVSISIIIILQYKGMIDDKNLVLFYPFLFILFLLLLLLSSKMILVATLVLLGFIFLNTKNYLGSISGVKIGVGVILIAVFLFFIGTGIKKRFSEINYSQEILKQEQYKYDTPLNGLTLRLTIWKIILDIIEEENLALLMGVGTGDAEIHLQQKYQQKGLYTGNPEFKDRGYLDYNAHSQYFEELLSNGLIGLVILLSLLFSPVYFSRNNVYSVAIILVFAFFFITESGLNRQAGNILFTLLVSLLIIQQRSKAVQ